MDKLTELLKAKPSEVNNRVTKLIEDNKNLEKKISKLESKIIESKIMSLYNDVCDLNDKEGKILVKFLSDINPKFLKDVVMMINNKYPKSIIILAACDEISQKVSVVVKINDMYVSKSLDAKVILNEILEKLNGKGGGKSNYAQGSGIYSNNVNLDKILLDIKEKTVAQLS